MTKVLIIEDDSFLSQMYATKLQNENYEVLVASDGEKGLASAKKNKPDIILLDLLMPKKDGFSVLAELHKDKTLINVPVLVLTNLSQKSDVDRCFALGAKDYLIKAHSIPSEVVVKVQELLSKNS